MRLQALLSFWLMSSAVIVVAHTDIHKVTKATYASSSWETRVKMEQLTKKEIDGSFIVR